MTTSYKSESDGLTTEEYARKLDSADPLGGFRERFYQLADGAIYMDGNSLGLLSRDAEAAVLTALDEWKRLGVGGWLSADPPWFYLGEELGKLSASLVGAKADEVVVTGATTVNLHNLVTTFYHPEGARRRILATELDFPSDLYALQSQIALHRGDVARDLIVVPSRDGRTVDEDDIIAALDEEVALALLPSVYYRSGQLLDMQRLAAAARERGIVMGFDCCHSIGAVPHHFDEWGVDFAFWCNYKYLNAGPGSIGSLYVNRRHFGVTPGLAGWWGYNKERQFDMRSGWEGAPGAGAWQISTPPVLATAPLLGSLRIMAEAGIERIREKSLAQTSYLMNLLEKMGLTQPDYGYAVGTPREPGRRGSHVAVEHPEAARINRVLKQRGVVPDFRPPNVVRLAPIALYTSYHDLWRVAGHLREIIDSGAYLQVESGRDVVA